MRYNKSRGQLPMLESGLRSRSRIARVRRDPRRRGRRRKFGILPWNLLKGKILAKACPGSASRRGITLLKAAEQNERKPATISSRPLEQAWLKQHQLEYAGAWIALEGAYLVAKGSSARQVLDTARSQGYDQPLVVHIPREPDLPFGGW
jgi:hypothetical protein